MPAQLTPGVGNAWEPISGLSGVGLLTAQWMVGKGARHLVVASRSGATEANAPQRAALEELGASVR